MRWNQTFSETENRLLEKCERDKRLNPYQSESPNQIQPEGLVDTDSTAKIKGLVITGKDKRKGTLNLASCFTGRDCISCVHCAGKHKNKDNLFGC